MANRQISPERQSLYYAGMVLAGIGFLLFGSTFVSGAMHFGDFTNFEQRARSEMMRAFIGMGMMIAGGVLSGIGRAGAAGSGLVLDPEQARKDVEPWSRMTGGVVKDVLDEADITVGSKSDGEHLPFDERLRRLQSLRDEGLISPQEFEETRKKILDSAAS